MVLLCPECDTTLVIHAPGEGICVNGHGVVAFPNNNREKTGKVIAKPTITEVLRSNY